MQVTTKEPEPNADEERANHLEEWKIARDTLKFFDDKLHDLRKYGFSFLTALTAAGTFLTQTITSKPYDSISVETNIPIPGIFNLGVFVLTLMLIVALHLLDRNYRVFLQAACTRAIVLERKLNLELSDIIAVRHRVNKINLHVMYVYGIFIFGITVLGLFVLYPDMFLIGILGICVAIAVIFICYQEKDLHVRFKNTFKREDWTVSPLECTRDENIKITLNNLIDFSRPNNKVDEEIGGTISINKESGGTL